jgi:hypothetical protein
MKRAALLIATGGLAVLVTATPVAAGPPGPPDHGVMEPASDGCPWPDSANPYLEGSVLKCLPAQIPWSAASNPEGGTDYGIRIVADPLVAVDGSSAEGWVVFRCQFRAGLKYEVIVVGLAPHTEFGVHAAGFGFGSGAPTPVAEHLGTIRTDANGGGVVAGVLALPPGGYALDVTVSDSSGARLSVPNDDPVGFAVLR